MNELTNINYNIHTETAEIANIVGIKDTLAFIRNLESTSGVAVKFVTANGELVMGWKHFLGWGNRLEKLIYG